MQLIGRRNVLASLGLGAGAYLLTPMGRQLVREAHAQAPPRRFVLFIGGGGFGPEYWPKKGASETDFTLDAAMAPLEPFKDQLLFMERFSNPLTPNLHGNGGNFLTLGGSISFDCHVANTLGKGAPIKFLNICGREVDDSDPQITHSRDGAGSVPAVLNPLKAYDSIFGNFTAPAASGPAPSDLLAQDRSVLDGVRADVTRLAARLAGSERAKLDQYLTSLRDLERQLGDLGKARGACAAPARPPATIYAQGRRAPRKPIYEAFTEIATAALVCGLVRVVTYITPEGELDWMPLERPDGLQGSQAFVGTHQMWHGKGTRGDHHRFYQFQYGNLAAVRNRLAAVREGNGTMADNTLLMNMSSTGGPHHNGWHDHYLLLVGSLGGKIRAGRYLSSPKMARSVTDPLVAVAQALGVETEKFGSAGLNKGAFPGVVS
jgi:hypothetical protein